MIDPQIQQTANQRQGLLQKAVFGVAIVLTLGVALAFVRADGERPWLTLALVGGVPILVLIVLLSLLLVGRRRGVRWLQADPTWGVEPDRRQRLLQAVRENRHLDGEDEALALDIAGRRGRQLWVWGLVGAAQAFNAASAWLDGRTVSGVVFSAAAGMFAAILAVSIRDYRRGQAFIRSSPRAATLGNRAGSA